MNFHKTIGFLATLLLTLGLGVPDSFAQAVENVTLTLSPDSAIDTDAATNVTAQVTVTLKPAATANMAVTVALRDITLDLVPAMNPAESVDYNLGNLGDIVVVIEQGKTSGTVSRILSFDPAADADADNEVVRIQAAVGTKTATDDLMITEFISGVMLSLSPDSFEDTADEATGTAEVMVTLNSVPSTDTEVTVTLTSITANTTAENDDFEFSTDADVTVTVKAGATSGTAEGTFTFDPAPDDDDADNEVVRIQAAVIGDGQTATDDLMITELISSVALTLSPSDSFKEETSTSVLAEAMVTLNSAATAATAVTVSVSDVTDAGNIGTAESGDYATIIDFEIVVTILPGAMSGVGRALFNFQPNADSDNDSESVVIQAASAGHTGTDMLTISEGEVESITLSLSPAMVKEADNATDITAEVAVTLNSAVGTGTTVTVMVSLDETSDGAKSGDYMIGPLGAIEVVFDGDGTTNMTSTGTGTFTFDPMQDGDTDHETVLIIAKSGSVSSDAAPLTITDDGESAGTISISLSLDEIREDIRARDVAVTVTLSEPAPVGGVVVAVTTALTGTEGTEDDPVTTPLPGEMVTFVDGEKEKTITLEIDPADDNVFTSRTIVVTGSAEAAGYVSGMDVIKVLDEDSTVGEIKIAVAPPSVTVGSTANSVKLTIDVVGQTDTPTGTKVTVSLATDKGKLSSDQAGDNVITEVVVTLGKNPTQVPATYRTQTNDGNGDGTRGTAYLTVDAGSTAGVVATVTATSDEYTAATRTISAFERDAQDASGYRVLVNKSNQWVPVGDKKVVVEIVRLDELALPWTAFGSIRVSLYDTTTVREIGETEVADALTASNIVDNDGAVSFTKSGTRGKISYIAATDRLKFELQISNNNTPRGNPGNPSGQYLGVYAAADFDISGTTTRLTNRQSNKPVFPNPAILAAIIPNEADRNVGDGKIFWVDTVKPANTALAEPRVTSGDEVGDDIMATLDDEIRVAIDVNISSGRSRFDIAGVQAQLVTVQNTADLMGTSVPSKARAVATANFTALQAANASRGEDSLYVTWTVTPGLFKSQTSTFVEGIGKVDTPFEGDNLQAYVRARIKDQAGNWSGWKQPDPVAAGAFDADSRAPKVSILYPSADPDSIYEHTHPLRFTGKVMDIVEGQNVDGHLNPLAILVDEELMKLEVFAVGADTLDISDQFDRSSIGDSTATYNTEGLNSPKKDDDGNFKPSSGNRAGTVIDLVVLATDRLGNTTKTMISGVTHDASPPVITDWFPKSDLLDDGQFNDATPPVFTLPEDVDSIAVTFEGSNGSDVTKGRGGVTTKGEDSIDFSGALADDTDYDMTIFVRDLAGNVFITPAGPSSGMRFNAEFDNPVANRYKVSASMDSVIAGQANMLTIQAEDHDAGSNTKRNALTYKNAARISAWDADGGAAESVWFEGTGVTDDASNPDGVAMLSAADWRIGKRTVTVKSNKATGFVKILVQHLDSGMGDTAVVGFDGAIDSLYVGAADFAGFEITAWEEGVEGAATEIWGDYTLRVVPVDRHGNPSVRAFKAKPASAEDSLAVLDTRVKNAFEYKNGIDVEIIGVPAIEDFALLILSIEKEGATYDLVAPDNRRSQTVQIRVVNASLMDGDDRSENIRSTEKFKISAPLTPELTLWVPGSDVDEAGNDVVIPADPGDITVTVAAAGFNAGDMVTFTRNGTAGDPVAADDDGVARLMITASVASTTTVSASNGLYSTDDLTITFDDTPPKPVRKKYVDANGDPVYLISTENMTVDVSDFLALVAAFGSSDSDDNYNAQADIDGNCIVEVADFLEFIKSWGKTAVGPATKPLVLLPGINENAEFSLSLGSERVVAGELVAVDVSLANVVALVGYGFALNYETDNFEFVSVAPADEDLLKSTGGETLFHHIVADGQVTVANGLFNGTAISGGGDAVRFVFRVLREFEDNARFEIANGLVFDPSQLQNPAVVAGVLELQSTPREFALHQNFPNPFNPDTTIKYDLAESADVTLQIYNVLGQVVRTLVASEAQNAGRYQIRWNGMDDRGVPVSSGIYFYQISADGMFSDVRKLMLLK